MGRIVMAVYQPKPGKERELDALVADHVARLRQQNLVTGRASIVMRSVSGAVIEVFEWLSTEAIESAHKNEAVIKMWGEFAEVCDYVPIGQCPEAAGVFSEFTPIQFQTEGARAE